MRSVGSGNDADMAVAAQPRRASIGWIDAVKGMAIVWIVWNHVAERIFGGPLIANPSAHWPPLTDRIAQLAPVGHGLGGIFENAFRYGGWAGDQGVGLFIVCSGFVLTYASLHGPDFSVRAFYKRRAWRLYPLWWTAHVFFIVTWFAIGFGLSPFDPRTLLSAAGLRFLPSVFAYFAPAWWYFGLAIQLYLVFPFLLNGLTRWGARRFFIACATGGCAVTLAGLYAFGAYVPEWSRGAIFITRLPELALGMVAAVWYVRDAAGFVARLRAPAVLGGLVAMYIAGNALSLTLWGMAFAPLLLSCASFALLVALLAGHSTPANWFGRHSYSIYLAHHPFVLLFVAASASAARTIAGVAAALIVSILAALLFERIAGVAEEGCGTVVRRWGVGAAILAAFGCVASAYAVAVAGDLAVRRFDPQEVDGWGERASLIADPVVGWKLRPNGTYRLRWESYDYVVHANALGFPGPLYPPRAKAGTLRIMTLGDAFTSAEGVDTQRSWPRVLESLLRANTNRRVEVMNFGITGYGPNQYAEVARAYASTYKPDLVIVGMFVNDYSDAMTSEDAFRKNIGFEKPLPRGWQSVAKLEQLREWTRNHVAARVQTAISGSAGNGYFLSNMAFLERSQEAHWMVAVPTIEARYRQIADAVKPWNGKVAVVLFPAPVQVCEARELQYYPWRIDLTDETRFDGDFPQREARRIASDDRLPFYDLRPALQASPTCPYQPANMHLTAQGQQQAAYAIAGFVAPAVGVVFPPRSAVATR